MISPDTFDQMLEGLIQSMPEELFDALNGGVVISEDTVEKTDEPGLLLGAYRHDRHLGNWIELYYGSFAQTFAADDDAAWLPALEGELRRLLRQHMANQAGIYTEE